jgi:hypothetical protein
MRSPQTFSPSVIVVDDREDLATLNPFPSSLSKTMEALNCLVFLNSSIIVAKMADSFRM